MDNVKEKISQTSFSEMLEARVVKLLKGNWNVDEFDKNYYHFFLDGMGEDLLEEDLEFFGLIQEALDWTHKDPDFEARLSGFMDHQQFKNFIGNEYKNWKFEKEEIE